MMIKVEKQHVEDLKHYLEKDPYANLFLLGDLEQFGLDESYQTFYVEYIDGVIRNVIFRFLKNSLHLHAEVRTDAFINKAKELLAQIKYEELMIAEKTQDLIYDDFKGYIQKNRQTTLSVYEPKGKKFDTSEVLVLDETDVDEICRINDLIFEANEGEGAKKRLATEMRNGSKIVYGIKSDGELVSMGSICAESGKSAMIIGVATIPEARGHGYAIKIVQNMSDDLLSRGKKAVLFYDNPQAASIYEKLGFEPHQKYYMNKLSY